MPDFLLKPIDQWTREDAVQAAKSGLPESFTAAKGMLEQHDYWQNGDLWVGQRGPKATERENLRRIEPSLVPDPILEEVQENRSNGLLQREPAVSFDPVMPASPGTPQETEQRTRVERVVKALARWWDTKRLWDKADNAFGRTAYAGRAALRVWIAPGNLQSAEPSLVQRFIGIKPPAKIPTGLSLEEALDIIEVSDPLPDAATLYTVPETQRKAAVILDTQILNGQKRDIAEVWTVEGAGQTKTTVLRILGAEKSDPITQDLGGRLPLAEMESKPIVTGPVIKNQSLLNFGNTILNRVLETAGFPERTISNAEPPGLWLPYPPDPEASALEKDTSGSTTFWKHRTNWVFGFSTVTELIGAKQQQINAAGREMEVIATPSITYKEPTDPQYVINAKSAVRDRIYHLVRQGHLASDSTAQLSGFAYQQARAQFEADLQKLKGKLEGMIRDVIEVVLAYAGLMSAEAKTFLQDFRCVVNLSVTSGPITQAEADLALKLRDGRLISQANAQGRVGIDDHAAETAAILADPMNRLAWVKAVADAITALQSAQPGITPEGIAFLLGLTPEQLEVFRTGVPPAVPKPGTPAVVLAA